MGRHRSSLVPVDLPFFVQVFPPVRNQRFLLFYERSLQKTLQLLGTLTQIALWKRQIDVVSDSRQQPEAFTPVSVSVYHAQADKSTSNNATHEYNGVRDKAAKVTNLVCEVCEARTGSFVAYVE